MASFKMRNSRTKKYNSDGSRIYNTFNSTGLVNKYENHNARFDSRNKGRELDLVDSNGNKLNNCSCTKTLDAQDLHRLGKCNSNPVRLRGAPLEIVDL